MTNKIVKSQKCIYLRNGIQLWIEEGEKLSRLEDMLARLEGNARIQWEGRTINTADLVGIFLPVDLEELTRRKNGESQCSYGTWHKKNDDCACWRKYEENQLRDWSEPEPEPTEEERRENMEAIAKLRRQISPKDVPSTPKQDLPPRIVESDEDDTKWH